MRLILGDNLKQPSIRDIILIGSFQQDLTTNKKLLKVIGKHIAITFRNTSITKS